MFISTPTHKYILECDTEVLINEGVDERIDGRVSIAQPDGISMITVQLSRHILSHYNLNIEHQMVW